MIPLFVPGPVAVDPTVLAAQALQPVYHRSEQYGLMLCDITEMLRETLGTTGEVYCVSRAGTACLETAIQNPCRPGDRVVVASNGYFGERLATLCQRLDLDTVHIRAHYSEPLPLQQIDRAPRTPAVALLVVHHETSAGRINDLTALGEMSRSRAARCIVDAIASAGTLPVDMDSNGLDVVIASSQKGLGGTPGARDRSRPVRHRPAQWPLGAALRVRPPGVTGAQCGEHGRARVAAITSRSSVRMNRRQPGGGGHAASRPPQGVRLVACDLDGTLLRRDHTLSPRTRTAGPRPAQHQRDHAGRRDRALDRCLAPHRAAPRPCAAVCADGAMVVDDRGTGS